MADTVNVTVKWNKQVFNNVELNLKEPGLVFKSQLFTLTGVEPARQKVMGFKGGILKDDADFSTMQIKPGQQIVLMGTAGELQSTQPAPQQMFIEDLPSDEQVSAMTATPSGLVNLGNTCYMNATLQCIRTVPELAQKIKQYKGALNQTDLSHNITISLRDLLIELENRRSAVQPLVFLTLFRQAFPQFAQRTQNGYAQQDADEFWSQLLSSLQERFKSERVIEDLFQGEFVSKLKCSEQIDEPTIEKVETFKRLECHIDKDTTTLYYGLKKALEEPIEKYSDVLKRTALYNKTAQISKLPPYLTVNFVRFFWKPKEQVKAKILKDVKFPTTLDLYDLCTEDYKKKIAPNREELRKRRDNEFAATRSNTQETKPVDAVATNNNNNTDRDTTGCTAFYELQAVLTHKGRSADSGHYVSWTKQEDGNWIKFDDDKVSQVSEEDVKKLSGGGDWHTSYIILYSLKKI